MSGRDEAAEPIWDRNLDEEAVKRLPPADRGRRAIASLTRKVELLERWAKDGVPEDAQVRGDRAKLRRWKDAGLGLWAWADPQIDAKDGRNAALMERFRVAVEAIAARGKGRRNVQRELAAKDILIAALEKQNIELVDRVRRLQVQVAALQARA